MKEDILCVSHCYTLEPEKGFGIKDQAISTSSIMYPVSSAMKNEILGKARVSSLCSVKR
jgi:hypothetical protein